MDILLSIKKLPDHLKWKIFFYLRAPYIKDYFRYPMTKKWCNICGEYSIKQIHLKCFDCFNILCFRCYELNGKCSCNCKTGILKWGIRDDLE